MSEPDLIDADTALSMLGRYSKWQMRSYFAYAIGFSIPFAWMQLSLIFIGDTPGHRCALPPNSTLNESIPYLCDSSGDCQYAKCEMYEKPGVENRTVPCQHGYWFDPSSGYDSTLATDWDLVCDKSFFVELSMMINNIGTWLGVIFFSRLSDLYGRKYVFLWCLWSNVILATVQAFSPNFTFYAVLAFIDGIQQQACLSVSSTLAVEIFPTAQRNFPLNAIEFFWATGYMSLVLIAYFIRNWRHLLLALSLPLLATVSFYWIIEESIPWLVANGRYKEADEAMARAAKMNKISLPQNIFSSRQQALQPTSNTEKESFWKKLTRKSDDQPSHSLMDVLKNSMTRKWLFCLYVIWFTNNLTYYSITFTVTYLPGDRYLNTFLYGLMEIPAYALTWFLLEKFGRRLPLSICHIVAGVALMLTFIQTQEWGKDLDGLMIAFSVIGKFCITCSYAAVYVHTPEIFPTNVRNVSFGSCMMMARVASLLGPYTRILARSHPWLPTTIMGLLSITAGALTLFLPETRWVPLPDTMEDVMAWKSTTKKKSVQRSNAAYEIADQNL